MARPSKQPHALPAILAALRHGATRAAAAQAARVDPTTVQRWAHCKTTQNQLAQAEAEAELFHVGVIRRAAEAGSWKASAWWLERRHPREWGRRLDVQVDVQGRIRHMAEAMGLDPDEAVREAEAILQEMRRRGYSA